MAIDNGGAYAIKGFNYQAAVIALIIINNYHKDKFEVYMEAKDDCEVKIGDDYHVYIQVKGEKSLSLNKLLNEKKSDSIIKKNFSKGNDDNFHKIIVFNFAESDLKDMLKDSDEILENCYSFTEKQKKSINSPKADRLTLNKTDFSDNLAQAQKYLIGEMHSQEICVDKRGHAILTEIFNQINKKSEIVVEKELDYEYKKIAKKEVEPLFKKSKEIDDFKDILKKFNFPKMKEDLIQKEYLKILLQYSNEKGKIIKHMIAMENISELNETDLILNIINGTAIDNSIPKNTQIAICISAYCEIINGGINE